jgi:hypothetical protein
MSTHMARGVPAVTAIEALEVVLMLLTITPLLPASLSTVAGALRWYLRLRSHWSRMGRRVHESWNLCTIEHSHECVVRNGRWRGCRNGCRSWSSLHDCGLSGVDNIALVQDRALASLPLAHA